MRHAALIDRPDGASRVLLVCEHASNHFPPEFGTLGLDDAARVAHVAWDIGALGLARALSGLLDATLVHAPVSRLLLDLNRPPHAPAAMPERSEVFDVPGNCDLDAAARAARVDAIYLPFHQALQRVITDRLAQGVVPVLVSIHSFTPVYHGAQRTLEFGVIHDGDDRYARALLDGVSGMRAGLNEPYAPGDGVTHLMQLHSWPYALPHAMIEVRNDLIADAPAQNAMANRIAPALRAALGRL